MLEGNVNGSSLVRGDQFTGLVVDGAASEIFQFELDGHSIQVKKTWQRIDAELATLDLQFKLSAPVRFRLDVMVPADCVNGCATLNNQLLIGWFGDKMLAGQTGIITSACQDQGEIISTLHPGRFQSVNFRWMDQDCLRFYFIW